MTIQEVVSIFLTGQSGKHHIEPGLAITLKESKARFDIEHIRFIVEPIETKQSATKFNDNTIYTFSGSFVWGFEKNGVLHAIPGDLSTQKTREELIDQGSFYVATDVNGVIIGIEESFAGNTYGIFPGKTSTPQKSWVSRFIAILIFGAVLQLIFRFL